MFFSDINRNLNQAMFSNDYEPNGVNSQFSDARSLLFNLEKYSIIENFNDNQDKFIVDKKTPESFFKPFITNYNDLSNLNKFLQNRFENLTIPITKYEKKLHSNFEYSGNSNYFNLDNLDYRQYNLDLYSKIFKNSKNIKINNQLKQNINMNFQTNQNIFIRNTDISQKNWNLRRNIFSDLLDEYYNNENNLIETYNTKEYNTFEKIKELNYLSNFNLKQQLSSYFIKKQYNLLLDKSNDFLDHKTINDKYTLKNSNNLYYLNFDKNTLIKSIWNIFFENNSLKNWKNKNFLKRIDQNNKIEMNSYLNLSSKLNNHKTKYLFNKNILNLKKKNFKENIDTLTLFLRKTNSINNGQFGRRKYKKLKKKYWNRINILEKYISNINNKLKNNIPTNSGNKIITKGKPIQKFLNNYLNKYFININYLKNINIDKDSTTFLNYELLNNKINNKNTIFNKYTLFNNKKLKNSMELDKQFVNLSLEKKIKNINKKKKIIMKKKYYIIKKMN